MDKFNRMRLIGILLGTSVLAWILGAQTAVPDPGRAVLDKTIAALGGDNFIHMQNRVETGRIYGFFRGQMSALDLVTKYVSYLPAESGTDLAIKERELLGKKRDYSYLFLPDQAWDVTYRGARPVSDEDWQRYRRTTRNDILYILRCRYHEPGLQIDYVGSDVYVSRHVEIVDVTDASDQVIRVYLDHNTMLPLHETFTWFDPQTREHNDETTDYDKYRDAGGVLWPFVVERARNGYKSYQMFADSAQVNQVPPQGTYNLPPGTQILKKSD